MQNEGNNVEKVEKQETEKVDKTPKDDLPEEVKKLFNLC